MDLDLESDSSFRTLYGSGTRSKGHEKVTGVSSILSMILATRLRSCFLALQYSVVDMGVVLGLRLGLWYSCTQRPPTIVIAM